MEKFSKEVYSAQMFQVYENSSGSHQLYVIYVLDHVPMFWKNML